MPCPCTARVVRSGADADGGTVIGDQVALGEALNEFGVLELFDIDPAGYRVFLRAEVLEGDLLGNTESGRHHGAESGVAEDLVDRGDG